MLRTGVASPDRSIMGMRNKKQYTMTCCMFLATAEIDRPRPTQLTRKMKIVRYKAARDPTNCIVNVLPPIGKSFLLQGEQRHGLQRVAAAYILFTGVDSRAPHGIL